MLQLSIYKILRFDEWQFLLLKIGVSYLNLEWSDI